jgi:hypothetical protein
VAIDVPFGFDVQVLHGSGGAVAVDLQQLHLAYGLREDSAAMFHGGGLKEAHRKMFRVHLKCFEFKKTKQITEVERKCGGLGVTFTLSGAGEDWAVGVR